MNSLRCIWLAAAFGFTGVVTSELTGSRPVLYLTAGIFFSLLLLAFYLAHRERRNEK